MKLYDTEFPESFIKKLNKNYTLVNIDEKRNNIGVKFQDSVLSLTISPISGELKVNIAVFSISTELSKFRESANTLNAMAEFDDMVYQLFDKMVKYA